MPRGKKKIAERVRGEKGDGGVYPLPNGKWLAKVPHGKYANGKTRYVKRVRNSEKEADEELKRLRAMLANNLLNVGPKIKFRQYAEEVLFDNSERIGLGTRDDYYRDLINYAFPVVGGMYLTDIGHHECQQLFNNIQAIRSASTSNKVRTAMSHVLERATKRGLIKVNPIRLTIKAKKSIFETNHTEPPWSKDEMMKVLQNSIGTNLEAFFALALGIGARFGEMLALEWSDVDFKNCTITINKSVNKRSLRQRDGSSIHATILKSPKTKSGERVIPVTQPTMNSLKVHKMNQELQMLSCGDKWQNKNLVLTNKLGGYVCRKTLRTHYRSFLEKIGVRYIRIHDDRHTFATLTLESDAKLLGAVSKAMGHSNVAITQNIYGKTAKIEHFATYAMGELMYPDQARGPMSEHIEMNINAISDFVTDYFSDKSNQATRQ